VGATSELDVLHGGLAAHTVRLTMMELQKGARIAAAFLLAHEGATSAISEPGRVPDLRGSVAGADVLALAGARPSRRGELLARQILEQHGECPVHDRVDVSVGTE
jgi:hypothetical protein